jgi:HEPN domain-containing protein
MNDDPKKTETRTWLQKAFKDLQSAAWLLTSPDKLYNAVAFHSQQSTEKALKAYLTWQEEPFEKTHSLVALVGKCLAIDQEFQTLREAAVNLTPYAVSYRYPGDYAEVSKREAEKAYDQANGIWKFLISKLPPETLP